MKKAQAVIDDVIGDAQLPSLSDRASIPYIDCILKEVMRCVSVYSSPVIERDLNIEVRINPTLPLCLFEYYPPPL